AQTQTTLDYLLNASLAETYLEVLRATAEPTLSNFVAQVQADPLQSNVSAKKIAGNYFLTALYSNYYLTFNADGTGTLATATLEAHTSSNSAAEVVTNFIWIRKGKVVSLTLSELFIADVEEIYTSNNIWTNCDDYFTQSEIESCDLQFNEIQLDLITETENHYLANLKILVTYARKNHGSIVYEGELDPQLARVSNVENFVAINSDALVGAELVGGFGIYYVESKYVSPTSLWKRTSINIAESDWVGRWTSFPKEAYGNGSLYDVNEDKSWRDGFEGQLAGSWATIDGHSQTALANGSWRMIRDLVSIQGDKYYLSICQGVEATPFVPASCYLDIEQKSVNFDTAVFWRNWSNPVFNEKVTGEPLYSVWGYLLSYDRSAGALVNKYYAPVSANRLFNRTQQTILEMTSASRNEIELCEYQLNASCNDADKRTYVRGIEIKLTVGAGGKVSRSIYFWHIDWNSWPTFSQDIDKVFMVPKGIDQTINITPDAGYVLDSIAGCGGNLNGSQYHVPELTATCEINVSFKTQ
ncbi:MAG: hypothetical protein K0Q78_1353, partial [Cellvibrio sp.]|nr:hypothetical protein [Cellvibrio sp.]